VKRRRERRDLRPRPCLECGEIFTPARYGPQTPLCKDCRAERNREQNAARHRDVYHFPYLKGPSTQSRKKTKPPEAPVELRDAKKRYNQNYGVTYEEYQALKQAGLISQRAKGFDGGRKVVGGRDRGTDDRLRSKPPRAA
jgi:hypothetical protein